MFFTSQEINIKWSTNVAKLLEVVFGPEDIQWAKEVHQRRPAEPSRHQGVPHAPGAPWWVVGPMGGFSTASQLYMYYNTTETLEEQR